MDRRPLLSSSSSSSSSRDVANEWGTDDGALLPESGPGPILEPDADAEVDDETQVLLTSDFEIGHYIRERIVPRAVLYFTGEGLEDEDEEYEDDDGDDDDDEDEDDDDEDEEDDSHSDEN